MVYHKRDYQAESNQLLEDKLFFVMYTNRYSGTLLPDFEGGHNQWMTQAELVAQEKLFESAYEFPELIRAGTTFVERSFRHGSEDY